MGPYGHYIKKLHHLPDQIGTRRYSRPIEITYDQGSEFIGHKFKKYLIETEKGITAKPSISKNPMSNAVSSSYSRTASVFIWHAHSRVVVLHTLYRGHRDTRLCPSISYRSLVVLLRLILPESPLLLTSVNILPCPLLLSPLPLPAPPPGQLPPVPTTASILAPQDPFSNHHTGLTVITYRCTIQMCSADALYTPTLSIIPPPTLPPPLRCIFTSCTVSSEGAIPSAVSPPGSETPSGPCPCGG